MLTPDQFVDALATAEAERLNRCTYVKAAGDEFSPRFHDWLSQHWSMWKEFEAAGDKVRDRGLTEYSAYVITNVLRWQADVRGIKFSLTNTVTPDLARLYNAIHGPLFKTSTRFGKETSHAS